MNMRFSILAYLFLIVSFSVMNVGSSQALAADCPGGCVCSHQTGLEKRNLTFTVNAANSKYKVFKHVTSMSEGDIYYFKIAGEITVCPVKADILKPIDGCGSGYSSMHAADGGVQAPAVFGDWSKWNSSQCDYTPGQWHARNYHWLKTYHQYKTGDEIGILASGGYTHCSDYGPVCQDRQGLCCWRPDGQAIQVRNIQSIPNGNLLHGGNNYPAPKRQPLTQKLKVQCPAGAATCPIELRHYDYNPSTPDELRWAYHNNDGGYTAVLGNMEVCKKRDGIYLVGRIVNDQGRVVEGPFPVKDGTKRVVNADGHLELYLYDPDNDYSYGSYNVNSAASGHLYTNVSSPVGGNSGFYKVDVEVTSPKRVAG